MGYLNPEESRKSTRRKSNGQQHVHPVTPATLPAWRWDGPSLHPLSRTSALLRPLLTPHPVVRPGSPQVRTRCFTARPPHLPPRLNPRLRCVVPARRIVAGLDMRFLFIGPPLSSSLPPPGQLPFRSWLRVVVMLSCSHEWFSYKRLSLYLQRAHAGRTPPAALYASPCRARRQ